MFKDDDGNLLTFDAIVANMPFSKDKWAAGFNPGGESSGNEVSNHFVDVNKMVTAGVAPKPVEDIMLSRYACYLIVMNGDPRKEVIAVGISDAMIQWLTTLLTVNMRGHRMVLQGCFALYGTA